MRLLTDMKRGAIFTASVVGAAAVVMLAGCSGSSTDTSAMPAAPTSNAAPHAAAVGAAVNSKLKLQQLALDSPIKETTDKNGLKFYNFKYTNNDGKVYQCVLPQAMGTGEHTISEWLCTFDVYKLPKVLAQKHVKKDDGQGLGDFPFIAPKPQEEKKDESQSQPAAQPQNQPLPPMPVAPQPSSMPPPP